MRVAVTQFATSLECQDNLLTCIRIINKAAICKPDLIILPQYANTCFYEELANSAQSCSYKSCYIDHNQAWLEAVTVDGRFLGEIAQLAKQHRCYILINVTLRQDRERAHTNAQIKSNISVTSCLFSPEGELVHQNHQQKLSGEERRFFVGIDNNKPIFDIEKTKLGFLMANDTMTYRAARELSFSGAQLLCNTLSFGTKDQSKYHDLARANENNIFIATANKVNSSSKFVNQSQIISPQGEVIAKVASGEVSCDDKFNEGFAFADIDINTAGMKSKYRPDDTYLTEQINTRIKPRALDINNNVVVNLAKTVNVAVFATYKAQESAIEDVCYYIENNVTDIIQLPELFFVADKSVTADAQSRGVIEKLSQQLIKKVSCALRPFQYLCTSIILDDVHQAVIISNNGVIASQRQLHFCNRYQWTKLSEQLNIITLGLEQGDITLAMLTADDANITEMNEVIAQARVQVLLLPIDIQEEPEATTLLISKAIENNICIVAASREKTFSHKPAIDSEQETELIKVKNTKSTGLIINKSVCETFLPYWKARNFSGYVNEPIVKQQYGKITKAVIHPN